MCRRRPRARDRPRIYEVCVSRFVTPSGVSSFSLIVFKHVEQCDQRVVAARVLSRDGRAVVHEGDMGHDRDSPRDVGGDGFGVVAREARAEGEGDTGGF